MQSSLDSQEESMTAVKNAQLFGTGPVLPVADIPATVDWYCEVLGFSHDFIVGEPPEHGSVTRGRVGIQFIAAPESFQAESYPGWNYVFVDDVDTLHGEFRKSGATICRPVSDQAHGMREFEISDCNGFRLRFGQYIAG